MARMAIDDMFMRDPRVRVLAKLCGISVFDARGRLLEVWSICYDRVSDLLSEILIDTSAEIEGFAKHMLEAELATRADGNVLRITGAKKRIKYLEAKSEAGRRGGVKSGEARRNQREAKPKQKPKQTEAPVNPPDLVPVPDTDHYSAAKPPSESRRASDHFQQRYVSAYSQKPDWGGKEGALLKGILAKSGGTADEFIRRTDLLFDGKGPKFLDPPFTLETISANWNRLVSTAGATAAPPSTHPSHGRLL